MDAKTDESAGKCPVMHTTLARANRDWWPNQLNVNILHQNSPLSNPMGEAFNYAEEFKSLDLAALKRDLVHAGAPNVDGRSLGEIAAGLLLHPWRALAGLAERVGDGGDEGLLHGLLFGHDNGTGRVVEARSAVDAHAVVAGVLDRAQLQHPGARGGQCCVGRG